MSNQPIRNIAIIAHVDHGKTTLVDCLLKQSGTFAAHEKIADRVMDSNDIERERGITILAKNCAIEYGGTRINIVDTPGHADFGGEVERVLSMVDGVLLLVDAVEGPMPQTRFVTRKALALGHKAIVVVNKIDRPGARPGWVVDQTFDLFDRLGATDEQLDFPVIYASALQGWASLDHLNPQPDMNPLFEAILAYVPSPPSDAAAPLQLQVSTLDYNSYVGRIGIGRVRRGTVRAGQAVALRNGAEDRGGGKLAQVLTFRGLERRPVEFARAGDIVAVTGIEDVTIGLTICDVAQPEGLPPIAVDEPTLAMNFQVNTSPLAGREGKFVTSRQIRERLFRELESNVALRVEETGDADVFRVSGRGELHLTILIENMRREGYELAVAKPQVLMKEVDGATHEPFEALTVDVEESHQGGVMQELGQRRAEMKDMVTDGRGRVRLEYRVPARGLIGFQGEFMNLTRGTGLISHIFDGYDPVRGDIPDRRNGVLISNEDGEAVAYALFNLQERGRLFLNPGDKLYEGMIIGIHSRENDLVVNPIKTKKLTNVRAAGKDDAILLTPPIPLTLEYAVEFIADDEFVEVTPASLRIRKRHLTDNERKRMARADAAALAQGKEPQGVGVLAQVRPVTRWLLIANVAIFLLQMVSGPRQYLFALWPLGSPSYPPYSFGFAPWQLVTYAFLHGSFAHVFFNMFTLYMFGSRIEELVSARRFAVYYLVCVIGAGVTQLIVAQMSGGPYGPTVVLGGIFGVLLAFGLAFPRERLMLLFPPIPMPAWLLVTLFGIFSLVVGATGTDQGVAHFAHLGGMLAGFLMILLWRAQRR